MPLIAVNMPFTLLPSVETVARMAMAMPAAIRAYSMDVAPSSAACPAELSLQSDAHWRPLWN